jgi:hypothetical protein
MTRARYLRALVIASFLAVMSPAFTPPIFGGDNTIEELIAKAKASRDHRAELYAKVARRKVEVASDHFATGEVAQAHAAVQEAVSFAGQALDSAKQVRKRLKQTDITLRKTSRRLTDVAGTLAFEDRPAVNQAAKQIEDIRIQVLELMFGPTRRSQNNSPNNEERKD